MKKEALMRGAELEPISGTLGISSGSGVVSMRTCWLNLGVNFRTVGADGGKGLPGLSPRHFGSD